MELPSLCYALFALAELALNNRSRPLTREEIASKHALPSAYLSRILSRLARAGLVRALPGRGGGYYLGASPSEITITAIVCAISEAPSEGVPVPCCDVDPHNCRRPPDCPLTPLWRQIRADMDRLLAGVSLADAFAEPGSLQHSMEPARNAAAVLVADSQGRVLVMNRAAQSLTGRSEATVLGHPLADVLTLRRDGETVDLQTILGRATGGGPVDLGYSVRLDGAGGSERAVAGTVAPISTGDGLTGARLTLYDVTEERRLEQRIAAVNRMETAGAVASGVAHQVCDLLTGVVGCVSLARAEAGSASQVGRTLESAEEAGQAAGALLRQLLDQSAGQPASRGPVALSRLLVDAAGLVTLGTAIGVSLNLAADLWPVQGDETEIAQALRNVLINAVEAMPEGGHLSITAENLVVSEACEATPEAGRYVKLCIGDSGPGISPEVGRRSFEPYTSTKPGRTGIGLTVTANIVRKHAGWIELDSVDGGGTVARVLLRAAQPQEGGTRADRRNHSIPGRALLVVDQPVIAGTLTRMLGALGYEVVATREIGKVDDTAGTSAFDAVFVDTAIEADSVLAEAVAEIRRASGQARLVGLTPYTGEEPRARLARLGFNAVLEKPFTFDDLKLALRAPVGAPL